MYLQVAQDDMEETDRKWLPWVEGSRQLTYKKGAPGDQVWDLLCVQLASYLEGGQLMWMMQVNQKSDYDDEISDGFVRCQLNGSTVFSKKGKIWVHQHKC